MKTGDDIFEIKRTLSRMPDGKFLCEVTPPQLMQLPTQCVVLTHRQIFGLYEWLNQEVAIDKALPDLSAEDRNVLMTGICAEEFAPITVMREEEFDELDAAEEAVQ